ncbi:MAG: hypothetical protein ACRCWQ_08380, partial [Bacilli bacterium]
TEEQLSTGIEEQNIQTEDAPQAKKSKFNPKQLMMAGGVLAVLALAVVLFIIFRPVGAKEAYFRTEIASMASTGLTAFDMSTPLGEFMDKVSTESNYTEADVDFTMYVSKAAEDPTLSMITDLFDTMKMKIASSTNPGNNEMFSTFTMDMNGYQGLSGEMYIGPEMGAIKIPGVSGSPLIVKNDEFGDLMRKLDPSYTGEEKLSDMFSTGQSSLTSKDMEVLQAFFMDFVKNDLSDAFFVNESVNDVKYGKETVSADKITFKMTSSEMVEATATMMERIAEDEKMLDILKTANSTSLDPTNGLGVGGKEMLAQQLKDAAATLRSESSTAKGTFESTIYVYEESIVKRDLKFEMDQEKLSFSYDRFPESDSVTLTKGAINVQSATEDNVVIPFEFKETVNGDRTTLTGSAKVDREVYFGVNDFSLTVEGDYETKNPLNGKYTLKMEIYEEEVGMFDMEFQFNNDMKISGNKLDQNMDVLFNFYSDETGTFEIGAAIAGFTEIKDVEMPQYDSATSIDMNNATPDQMMELQTGLQNFAMDFLSQTGMLDDMMGGL